MLVLACCGCGRCWPRTPIITACTARIAPWGSHHRSGLPNHLSSCRLEASCDEIDSVGLIHEYAQVA
jgi:hypothetical protein